MLYWQSISQSIPGIIYPVQTELATPPPSFLSFFLIPFSSCLLLLVLGPCGNCILDGLGPRGETDRVTY